jgi:hypothetical protein
MSVWENNQYLNVEMLLKIKSYLSPMIIVEVKMVWHLDMQEVYQP